MAQKTIKKYEVWLTCEQWRFQNHTYSETFHSDLAVYPSLEEAIEEWERLRNNRNNREGCNVSPSKTEDYISENVIVKFYNYTPAEYSTLLVRTTFVKKYYYK